MKEKRYIGASSSQADCTTLFAGVGDIPVY